MFNSISVKVVMVSLISVLFVGCASNTVPKKPAQPKGKWVVINQEQIDLLEAKKAEKAKKAN